MSGDVNSLNAKMEMSELRERVPPGRVRVLVGIIYLDRPYVSLLDKDDFPDEVAAKAAMETSGIEGAIYRAYDHSGELLLEVRR